MSSRVEDILSRHKHLEGRKGRWLSHWQELAEVFLPRRADFTVGHGDGAKRNTNLFDSTQQTARRSLRSGIDGLIKPKTARWMHARDEDEELNEQDEAREHFEAVDDRIYRAIYDRRAHFVERSQEVDDDLVTFGSGLLFTAEGKAMDRLMFRSFHLRDVTVAENEDGEVDTFFIRQSFSARQAARLFGEDNLRDDIKNAAAGMNGKSPDEKFRFLWAVLPRDELDPRRKDSTNMPWASLKIDIDGEKIVSESGFNEMPFAFPRWDSAAGEVFGRSPAMIALPDALTLQAQGKTLLKAGQRAADPPMWALSESVIGKPRPFPGQMTFFDGEKAREFGGRPPFGQMDIAGHIPIGREMQNDTREQIQQAFFKNIFNLPAAGPQMTATEILERKEEFLREIGPTLAQLENNYTAVIVERVYHILDRAGALPEKPEILRDRPVKFDLDSPVDRARKQVEAAGMARAFELIGPLVQGDPGVLDHFDTDEIVRDTPEIFGLPQKWLRTKDEVQTLRGDRKQKSDIQDAIATVQQGAAAAQEVGTAADTLVPPEEQAP